MTEAVNVGKTAHFGDIGNSVARIEKKEPPLLKAVFRKIGARVFAVGFEEQPPKLLCAESRSRGRLRYFKIGVGKAFLDKLYPFLYFFRFTDILFYYII